MIIFILTIKGGECHGGSTYCATAALKLMGRLDALDEYNTRSDLTHWCQQRYY
jgi:prenyltransferase beta subunit